MPLLCLGVPGNNKESDVSYETLVRRAIRLGGCSSSRSMFVGACAAALESKRLPDDWVARFEKEKMSEMNATSNQLASLMNG